jgi:hypothetical protein
MGHISCAVDLKEDRFSSVATGSISGFLRLFFGRSGISVPHRDSHSREPGKPSRYPTQNTRFP